MMWSVIFGRKAKRDVALLPSRVKKALAVLVADIEQKGPVRGDWPNYSKLGPGRHHCHLKKGKTTYVAVWEERSGETN